MAGGGDGVEGAEQVEQARGVSSVVGAGGGAEERQERVDHPGDQQRFPGSELAVAGLALESDELGAGDRSEAGLVGQESEVDTAVKADPRVDGGVDGLLELRGRFPKDPRVLKPLALELAKSPEQTSELLRVLDVLFAEAPKEVEDRELGRMLYRAALSTTTSQRAIELMRTRLGSTGADMLFDIVLNNQEFRGRARSALETAEVQRNLSPPLKIAYDLYFASTCAARVDLLPQAIKDGDERAIFVLTLFSVKPKTACPKKKPCYAPCGKEAPAMEEAIKQIRARLLASVPRP